MVFKLNWRDYYIIILGVDIGCLVLERERYSVFIFLNIVLCMFFNFWFLKNYIFSIFKVKYVKLLM